MKMNMWIKGLLLAVGLLFLVQDIKAQRIALKSNAVTWATLSPNFGAEFRITRFFTVNGELSFNPFSFGNFKPHHVTFQPEVRYWFSSRPHARWFVGVAGLASVYNMTLGGTTHDGTAIGAGPTGGYSFVLNSRWSMEATLGLGLIGINERRYKDILPLERNNKKIIFAPIKAGVTFVYLLK